MIKKMLKFASLIFTLFILAGSTAFAGSQSAFSSGFDVSIDRVIVNGQVVSQSKSNLLEDDDLFFIDVDITAVKDIEKGHVEVSLRGRQSGDVVADATSTFDAPAGASFTAFLAVFLNDGLKRENDFELTVKVVDARGRSEQKTYGIKTKQARSRGLLDVSIDKVTLNNHVLAASKNTFVEEADEFKVTVEFTSLEETEFAHVEAILKDLRSGNVVADATKTFNLKQDKSNSAFLKLELLEDLRKSDSFELTIRIVNAEGDQVKQAYGIRMKDGINGVSALDLSIDSVEVENKVIAPEQTNFVILTESSKEIDVKVRLTSLERIDNARIDAVLMFENGNVVADTTTVFKIGKDESTVKDLELPLIGKFVEGSMKLKIKVTDAEGDSAEKVYGLRLSKQKTPFLLSSISLEQASVQAGKSVGVNLNIKNMGVMPVEAVVAKVTIEELGMSMTRFVDKIADSHKAEFIFKIPENANAGAYTIRAEVASQFSNERETSEVAITITEKGQEAAAASNRLRINVPIVRQSLKNDGSEAAYPITFTNNDALSHAYTVMVDGPEEIGLRLDESNTFVLKPRESNTINVYASTRTKEAGEKLFNAIVKENQKAISYIPLKADVSVQSFAATGLKTFLMAVLILIAIALAGIGLFYGARKYLQKDENGEADESVVSEIPEGEAYY